ncbi:MAG: polysaccharide biosynthesis protein, partial [Gammaproteobacteria bacterium]|nr:polysaccharide biosynthesis protein [Gammaproteobacteria bacterium]
VVVGALSVAATLFLVNRLQGIPRASLILYPIFLILLLGGPRLVYRMWKDHGLLNINSLHRKRVLIIGAGRAGDMLARDMLRDHDFMPIGYLDDQEKLVGAKMQGIPVLGAINKLPEIVDKEEIDSIVIAIPSASNSAMQKIVELCEHTNIPFRTLPRMRGSANHHPSVSELKEVAIEDILGRDPVSLDWKNIRNHYVGKTILVSGGGGSIGSELCRQISRLGPASLIIFDISEYNLYSIQMELGEKFPNIPIHAVLGDVCDDKAVEHMMGKYHPDIIFHAAAYKHVPMLQEQIREAVYNNVMGTRNLALAADKFKCSTFIMISTDKAVNPTNVMGATKRSAEIFCQNFDALSETAFITVRFGNVLGSAGSVVPLFQEQIANGGPITVTHPDIIRYFMTIPEASQLIMQSGIMGDGGEIYVLEMGEPVKITYLAEQMIRLSGKKPGEDIEIVYTGLRPGEKLYEELFYKDESLLDTGHSKILLANSRKSDWKYIEEMMNKMSVACIEFNEKEIKSLLKEFIPEMSDTKVQSKKQLDLLEPREKKLATSKKETATNPRTFH